MNRADLSALLHRLWTRATHDSASYDKAEWMALERAVDALTSLVRRAATDLVEPMGISHMTLGTEWREVADVWIAEARATTFGPDDAAFGLRGSLEDGSATPDDVFSARHIPELVRQLRFADEEIEALRSRIAALCAGLGGSRVEALRAGLGAAIDAIDRDRSGMVKALDAIKREIRGRLWIIKGRGPYEWDDDRYKEEAGAALRAVLVLADDALIASGTLADVEFKKAKAVLAQFEAGAPPRSVRIDVRPGTDYEVSVGTSGEASSFGAADVEEILGTDRFSTEEVLQILKNVGVDPSCGACACQAFTGSNGYEHTCGKTSGITITAGPVLSPRLLCMLMLDGHAESRLCSASVASVASMASVAPAASSVAQSSPHTVASLQLSSLLLRHAATAAGRAHAALMGTECDAWARFVADEYVVLKDPAKDEGA